MKIFVTGIAGFLGSHIAEALLKEGHDVSGCDDLSGGDVSNVPAGAVWLGRRCQEMTPHLLAGVDTVYHCAALAHEGLSVFSPKVITESIFGASVSIFTAAIQAGVRRIVYCSSMSRYGDNPVPFTEDMIPKPQDPYAIAKVASEDVLKLLADVHGIEYVIAVPHNLVGERQKYNDPYRNVAAIMTNLLFQGRSPVVYGDGKQKRCFTDIRDVIPLFLKMLTEGNGEVFNIGPDEEFISINELAEMLIKISGQAFPIERREARPQEVELATCSSDKIRERFGYETKYSLEETLETLVDYIREIGPKAFRYHLNVEIPSANCPSTWTQRYF